MNEIFRRRVDDFLAQRHIAVAGYSTSVQTLANGIFDKFVKHGYEVYAVNPKGGTINGVTCYTSLRALPVVPDAVMICTPPAATLGVLEECRSLGIGRAWIHRSIDQGSFSAEAEQYAQDNHIDLIPLGCPLMFLQPDIFHQCMKWVMNWRGKFEVKEESEVLRQ